MSNEPFDCPHCKGQHPTFKDVMACILGNTVGATRVQSDGVVDRGAKRLWPEERARDDLG